MVRIHYSPPFFAKYKKPWKLLIDKDWNKPDLRKAAGISTYTVARMTRGENVSVDVLMRICQAMGCDVGDNFQQLVGELVSLPWDILIMAKKNKTFQVASDGSESFLFELLERFSVKRAVEWLRIKFPSFDTSRAEALACDATKNEKEYFAAAELLGYVTRLPAGGCGRAGRATLSAGGTRSVASDDTNKPLLVAAIEMRKDLTERTSRLVQFNYAKKLLQNAIVQGAQGVSGLPSQGIFFFYDRDGYFRLSLVTGEVEKRRFKYNEAKRQSFYIEPNAANNIVKRRLTPPIGNFSDLKDVFSVEQLTKEFYTKLFDWYTWAMSSEVNVHFPNDLADKTDDRKYNNEAIIRMITRLMFTWFIRQRKLVPDVLFDREGLRDVLKRFEPGSMEQDNYYRAILQNLFFATFNCPQTGKGKLARRWIDADVNASGNGVGLSDDYRVTTVYRYKNEFKQPDEFLERMKKVPFLNCALFDCLDKVEREVDGGRKLYFDGFSTKKKRQAFVPNGLFFDDERGIINLFNLYEFTVNENNADDSDVALDPELLGKVFENLLGAFNPETQETARNATGSFYTPREIVDYMVEESLKAYLREKVEKVGGGGEWNAKLDDLFDRNKAAEGAETLFSLKEREAILQALYNCKILDPACGSGAFPMGILHCMVRLLSRLDPQCLSIREQLLARYKEDKATVDPTETAAERRERLEELESRLKEGQHYPDYERKLYLIENCIYGVDIQPIATQISKLRFFISLLCDQLRSSYDPEAENFGLLSLPNLEAKFVCANTLIALPDIEGELKIGDVEELRKELQANRHKIFRARSTRTKEKYKAKDLETRDKIREAVRNSLAKPDVDVIEKCRAEIEDAKKRREAVAAPDWYEEDVEVQTDLFAAFEKKRVRKDRNEPKRKQIDAEIAWAEQKIKDELRKAEKSNVTAATQYARMVAGWDPYDQNASSKFFDAEWMFNIKNGFDVVIGNPPYVQLQANGGELAKMYQGCGYETFEKTGDLYCLFTERGHDLASCNGTVSYIMPNKWMIVEYGRPLRKLFKKNRLLQLLNFGDVQFFESATNYVVVFLSQRAEPLTTLHALSLNQKTYSGDFLSAVHGGLASYPLAYFGDESWVIIPPDEFQVLQKMKKVGKELKDWPIEIYRGILTGYNDAFYIDAETRAALIKADPKSKELIKPLLRGRDITAYATKPSGLWLINVHNGVKAQNIKPIDVKNYPAVKAHMDQFIVELKKRGDKGDTPYNLRNCAYLAAFAEPKIIYPNMTTQFPFMYDESGVLTNQKCFIMTTTQGSPTLKYLASVFNTRIAKLWIWYNLPELNGGAREISKVYFEHIPIPPATPVQQQPIIALVDRILAAKKKDPDADTSAWEAEIDRLVYQLYGLTEEEIAVVEGKETDTRGASGETQVAGVSGETRIDGVSGERRCRGVRRVRPAVAASAGEEESEVLD